MMAIKGLNPLLNRCLVRRVVPNTVTKSGIILTEKSKDKEKRIGVVVATGPGDRDEKGQLIPTSVKVGEYVLLPEYQGTKVDMADSEGEFYIYRDLEILAKLEGVETKH